jgi:diguanylate cyclase (GGDEF)-like protein
MEQLPREIERATRYGRPLAVVMCDVDHFKKINDTHGHHIGDEVLKWFVGNLNKTVRHSDWVARYGGEEFVVVLPETNVINAAVAAEHLRSQVAVEPFIAGSTRFPVTASFGTSGWKANVPDDSTLDALMAKCDAGVYASKAAGRNRVTTEAMD